MRSLLFVAGFLLATGAEAQGRRPMPKAPQSKTPVTPKTPPEVKGPAGKLPGAGALTAKLPDLIVSDFDITGPAKYVGTAWHVPVKARLTNQGAGDAKYCGLGARFIDGFFSATPPPVKFVRLATFWNNATGAHAYCPPLQAGNSTNIVGYSSINDPMKKLEGAKIYLRLFVDAQTDDTPQPDYVRVKEANEKNNWSDAQSVVLNFGDLTASLFDLAVDLDEQHLGAGKYRPPPRSRTSATATTREAAT
jgi:hypothetical protein